MASSSPSGRSPNLTEEDAAIWGQSGPLYAVDLRMIETPRRYGIELTLDL